MRTILPLVLSELKLKFQVFVSAKDHLLQAIYWWVLRQYFCSMSVPSRTDCVPLYLVFDRKELELREFSWQRHYGCHLVSFVKEHCFNISTDIFIQYCTIFSSEETSWGYHFPNLHNTKTSISLKQQKNISKGKHHVSVFWKAFQISNNYFSFHGHLNRERRIS